MLDIFVLKSLVFIVDNFNAKVLFLLLIILFFKIFIDLSILELFSLT